MDPRTEPTLNGPKTVEDALHHGQMPTIPGGPVDSALPPTPVPDGKPFGPYRLRGVLGKGGMGIVYDAVDVRIGRRVALKTLVGPDAVRVGTIARFQREVEIASRLKHPNIVTIYEVGVIGETPYFAMELLEGEPLSQVLAAEGRLPPRAAAKVTRDIARALAFAHDHGIVHRDVKPQNVMVERCGETADGALRNPAETALKLSTGVRLTSYRVVLTDFGLARNLAEDSRLTRSGEAIGTPLYMSPEQARGDKTIDALSDVYSLGAVLYELLTGKPPFDGPTIPDILHKIVSADPVPPRVAIQDLSPDLEVICLKAMEKDRAKRYASAREMSEDLERFLDGAAIRARPPGRVERAKRWVRKHPTAAAVCGICLAFAAIAGALVIGGQIADTRKVARLRGDAERALAGGDPARARRAAEEALHVRPSDPSLKALLGAARAAEHVQRCDALLAERDASLAEQARLNAEAKAALERIDDADPPSKKLPVWRLEDQARERGDRAAQLATLARQELAKAIGFAPNDAEALRRLAELHMRQYEEARARRDESGMREARSFVELYDREGRFSERFERKAVVRLTSDPPGAEVYAFRYEERERRLVPCPYEAASGAVLDPPEVTLSEGEDSFDRLSTAYPLAFSERNLLGRTPDALGLPPGSYLLVLRAPGRVDCRYPVCLQIEEQWEGSVRLRRREEYPRVPPGAWTEDPTEYWCYVPGGPFTMGHDPKADNPNDREGLVIPDYFVARFEFTNGEVVGFLTHPEAQGAERVKPFFPDSEIRQAILALQMLAKTGNRRMLYPWNGIEDAPAGMLRWPTIEGIGRWLTHVSAGDAARYEYSPPNEAEWEKAGRGVDGRFYPWGSTFDWAFCCGAKSMSTKARMEESSRRIGRFMFDESPYGVRDLAGGMSEWCTIASAPTADSRPLRGGAWYHSAQAWFRCATRYSGDRRMQGNHVGFRLVARESK